MSSFNPHQPSGTFSAAPGTGRSADGRNRVQQGVPTGGQFAAERHSDAVISLNLNRPPQPPAYVRIPQQVFTAVRSLVANTARKLRGRSMQGRPAGRPRAFSARAKLAVTGLVLAASAMSLTACGADKGASCQAAPDFGSPTVATASYIAPASVTAAVPEKGGGGGHGGGGHSSGHASSGHASEGSTSHESGTSGGTSSGGFRWPWTSHSSGSDQCKTDAPTTKS